MMLFWRLKMQKLNITNPEKIVFPDKKITKLDVVNYYINISTQMLPFVKNRVLSVIRCHENINGECFFKKHPQKSDNVERVMVNSEEYFYIKSLFQLVFQTQNGTIEFHSTPSPLSPISPYIMVFDLDPDQALPLKDLTNAVKLLKTTLDNLNLTSFLKTSGGKGFHIVLPFKKVKSIEAFYNFSKNVAELLESKWPNVFTTNIKKSNRKGKIFVDYLRNNLNSTCVCPYSLRARKGAPISFPISWEDLEKIKPDQINLNNYKKYLNNSWEDFFKLNQKIN